MFFIDRVNNDQENNGNILVKIQEIIHILSSILVYLIKKKIPLSRNLFSI